MQDLKDPIIFNNSVVVKSLEQTKEISRTKFFEIIAMLSKVLILTAVIFGAFFIPFLIGVESSNLKEDSSRMEVEIREMESKIREYNQKIAAYSEKILMLYSQSSEEKSEY